MVGRSGAAHPDSASALTEPARDARSVGEGTGGGLREVTRFERVVLSLSRHGVAILPRRTEPLLKESCDAADLSRVVKLLAPVTASVDDFKLNRKLQLLVQPVKFVRLINRDLRILISVNQQQRRVFSVNVENGTGEFCQFREFYRRASKQQVQRRDTNAQSVGRGLLKNRHEICGTVIIDNRLDR